MLFSVHVFAYMYSNILNKILDKLFEVSNKTDFLMIFFYNKTFGSCNWKGKVFDLFNNMRSKYESYSDIILKALRDW